MKAIIKQIQDALEHGRPLDVQAGPIAAQVLKEIQKQVRTSEKNSLDENVDFRQKKVS
jgi:hypothetical protein